MATPLSSLVPDTDGCLTFQRLGLAAVFAQPLEKPRMKSSVFAFSIAATFADPIAPVPPHQFARDRLKVSERWVYEKSRRRCLNPLPCIRIGRYLRFDWTTVSAWLRRQERGT